MHENPGEQIYGPFSRETSEVLEGEEVPRSLGERLDSWCYDLSPRAVGLGAGPAGAWGAWRPLPYKPVHVAPRSLWKPGLPGQYVVSSFPACHLQSLLEHMLGVCSEGPAPVLAPHLPES